MKFAKELAEQAIPEWNNHYFDYKTAKKRIKAVARAVRNIPAQHRPGTTPAGTSLRDAPVFSLLAKGRRGTDRPQAADHARGQHSTGLPITERSPLARPEHPERYSSYGSMLGSPPHSPELFRKGRAGAPSLELPAPAIENESDSGELLGANARSRTRRSASPEVARPPPTQLAHVGNAYDIRPPSDLPTSHAISNRARSQFLQRTNSSPVEGFRRLFSTSNAKDFRPSTDDHDVALEAYREVDFRRNEFMLYLDKELRKIETFYEAREDEAKPRLEVLREQLHVLRERRLLDIIGHDSQPHSAAGNHRTGDTSPNPSIAEIDAKHLSARDLVARPLKKSIDLASDAMDKLRSGHFGKSSRAMGVLGTPNMDGSDARIQDDAQRDYSRNIVKEPGYRAAKRKMKAALAGYYAQLELLKSYALLNREAFRKATKKYNKNMKALGVPTTDYMDRKVNKAHFVSSQDIDHLMDVTVDLYARYFEQGNKKVAVGKLRSKSAYHEDSHAGVLARAFFGFGAGTALGIHGLVSAVHELYDPHNLNATNVAYLLQLYGGVLATLFLVAGFALNCAIFRAFRVNYAFIFEIDRKTALGWEQIAELVSYSYFLLGLFMCLNFTVQAGGQSMFLNWFPVMLALAVGLLVLPAPVLYHRARLWLMKTLGRLALGGTLKVEFRDFIMGDMFCSLTYVMGNIELFPCLYIYNWNNPAQCNSSHSWVLGIMTALPGFLRATQCVSRYANQARTLKGKARWSLFPHVFNLLKYIFTVLQNVWLSVYRIHQTDRFLGVFIGFSIINSIYCIIWDINYDWSLWDWKFRGLRKTLVFHKHQYAYYAAMALDAVLRFNWIFYAIYTQDAQHSSVVAFAVACTEILRRNVWTVFRIENEHVNNIEAARASKDLPLPYVFAGGEAVKRAPRAEEGSEEDVDGSTAADSPAAAAADGAPSALDGSPDTSRVERQSAVSSALQRANSAMRTGHARDYQRRKRPDEVAEEDSDRDDDDDDDDDSDA